MARVLVVGGAGYVGSHAVKELARRGHEVVTFDNLSRGHRELARYGAFELGDISDGAAVLRVLSSRSFDVIMHFAAFAYVHESVLNPADYYENNVAGSLALLREMRRAGCDRLVFSSTCATYGEMKAERIDEQHPQQPINPYGASKCMVERVLLDYGRAYGLKSIIFRYFNAAGADPDCEIGELHDPETHLIPLALAAASGGAPLNILGGDYPTPDGTCIRDYVHVCDLARAHVLAVEALARGGDSAIYNLGNARPYSVKEVLDTVARVTGREVPHSVGPRRPGDPAKLVGDFGRATRELGWRPELSSLDQMVETAWRWYRRPR